MEKIDILKSKQTKKLDEEFLSQDVTKQNLFYYDNEGLIEQNLLVVYERYGSIIDLNHDLLTSYSFNNKNYHE